MCQHGDTKLADDDINQCICNDGEWLCTNVEYKDSGNENDNDDGGFFGIPAPSIIAALGVLLAIARRRGQ